MYQLKIILNGFRNAAWDRDLASIGKPWACSLISLLLQTTSSSLNMLKYVIRGTCTFILEKHILNKWGKPPKFLKHRDQVLYKDWCIHERTHG